MTPYKSAASTSSGTPTGSWRHPAIDIVAQRNSQKGFTETNFHRLMINGISLFLCWFIVAFFRQSSTLKNLIPTSPTISFYAFYALWGVRSLLVWNILESLYNLLRPVDEFTDIPLTPEQRKLLGLNPDTPLSPAAAEGSISRKATATPPPMTPSPLRMGGVVDRRSSFGSPSPASARVGSSVVPSNKWLYEKNLQRKGAMNLGAALGISPNRGVFSPRPPGGL
ncbi:uncharacterized protein LAJ45_09202 [Morchella importuna]|uniref:uncharacterized protein n=1 Tax=Morchella importuna TaxID=1174673 RepID=UPI001E8DC117|nr:uncharacterized protein LAJ45_09202 [Morchella importuna]KAH8146828.1 hypothetical protein LAJ45_09202 [Morchella importuna]